MLSLPNKASL